MHADLHVEYVADRSFYNTSASPAFHKRTVTALNNLLRTGSRELPQDDYATFACLRDTWAQTLASGKPCEGRLSTYE